PVSQHCDVPPDALVGVPPIVEAVDGSVAPATGDGDHMAARDARTDPRGLAPLHRRPGSLHLMHPLLGLAARSAAPGDRVVAVVGGVRGGVVAGPAGPAATPPALPSDRRPEPPDPAAGRDLTILEVRLSLGFRAWDTGASTARYRSAVPDRRGRAIPDGCPA